MTAAIDLSHMLTEGPAGHQFDGLLPRQLELFPETAAKERNCWTSLFEEIFGEYNDLLKLPMVALSEPYVYTRLADLPAVSWGPPLLDTAIGDE